MRTRNSCKTSNRPFSNFMFDFSDLMGGVASAHPKHSRHTPATNIIEAHDHFRIDVLAPGFRKEMFEIRLDQQKLTISLKPEEERLDENERFNRREFQLKGFERAFILPRTIQQAAITANYEAGILTIKLPKVAKEEETSFQIEIS